MLQPTSLFNHETEIKNEKQLIFSKPKFENTSHPRSRRQVAICPSIYYSHNVGEKGNQNQSIFTMCEKNTKMKTTKKAIVACQVLYSRDHQSSIISSLVEKSVSQDLYYWTSTDCFWYENKTRNIHNLNAQWKRGKDASLCIVLYNITKLINFHHL